MSQFRMRSAMVSEYPVVSASGWPVYPAQKYKLTRFACCKTGLLLWKHQHSVATSHHDCDVVVSTVPRPQLQAA